MTDGNSQGLLVIVAVVIFGIFVLISYLLFRDNLKPSLSGIFTDGLEQANCAISNEDESNPICNPKFNNSHEFLSNGSVGIGFADKKETGEITNTSNIINIWENSNSNSEILSISISEYQKKYPKQNLIIEDNMVLMRDINLKKLYVKDSFLSNGYQLTEKNNLEIIVNNELVRVANNYKDNIDSTSFISNYYLEIGEINTIQIVYTNSYGGISKFKYQVNILP